MNINAVDLFVVNIYWSTTNILCAFINRTMTTSHNFWRYRFNIFLEWSWNQFCLMIMFGPNEASAQCSRDMTIFYNFISFYVYRKIQFYIGILWGLCSMFLVVEFIHLYFVTVCTLTNKFCKTLAWQLAIFRAFHLYNIVSYSGNRKLWGIEKK